MSKIVRFRTNDQVGQGVLLDESTVAFIEGDVYGDWRETGRTVQLQDVTLLSPVVPPNVLAIGLNYRPHVAESGATLPERPILFIKATTAVCGPGEEIVLPRVAPHEVDYEGEMAIVIGKPTRHVSEKEALDYVLGYTCANDVSARDCQHRLDRQWARGKSFDTFAPLGPWIETGLDPQGARIQTRLNGELMQEGNTSELIFSCSYLVSYLSHCLTLLPGTVILSGTPEGVGFARKPPIFLRPGDVVEVEIEGIGRLRNPVVAED